MKLFYSHFLMIALILFSCPLWAHNGSHNSKNCFLTIAQIHTRLTGYQFQGLHPDQAYCRFFPYLGEVIIKIEPVNPVADSAKVSLQLAKLNYELNFNAELIFKPIKTTPFQNFKSGVNMIQANISERGIYAVQIELQQANQKVFRQNFLFLVGISKTQVGMMIAGLIPLVMGLFRFLLRQKDNQN